MNICTLTALDKLRARSQSGKIERGRVRKSSETYLIFRACTFCIVKKNTPVDLQISSQIDQTMRKL